MTDDWSEVRTKVRGAVVDGEIRVYLDSGDGEDTFGLDEAKAIALAGQQVADDQHRDQAPLAEAIYLVIGQLELGAATAEAEAVEVGDGWA